MTALPTSYSNRIVGQDFRGFNGKSAIKLEVADGRVRKKVKLLKKCVREQRSGADGYLGMSSFKSCLAARFPRVVQFTCSCTIFKVDRVTNEAVAEIQPRWINRLAGVDFSLPSHVLTGLIYVRQVVLETTSSTTLTSSPNPSTQGQAVTFAAKILSPTVIPKGPVTFTAGKTVLGTVQLSGGKATLTISSLAVGSTKVTATYYGDSNIAKSSASVIQTVQWNTGVPQTVLFGSHRNLWASSPVDVTRP
jgi:hypothetical protein